MACFPIQYKSQLMPRTSPPLCYIKSKLKIIFGKFYSYIYRIVSCIRSPFCFVVFFSLGMPRYSKARNTSSICRWENGWVRSRIWLDLRSQSVFSDIWVGSPLVFSVLLLPHSLCFAWSLVRTILYLAYLAPKPPRKWGWSKGLRREGKCGKLGNFITYRCLQNSWEDLVNSIRSSLFKRVWCCFS